MNDEHRVRFASLRRFEWHRFRGLTLLFSQTPTNLARENDRRNICVAHAIFKPLIQWLLATYFNLTGPVILNSMCVFI